LRVLIEAESVDVEAELAKAQKDIDYYSGFKRSIEAKLSNEKFVSGAPSAVVEAERKKLADAETDFLDFASYPTPSGTSYDPAEFASVEAHVVALRTFRAEKNIAFKSPLTTDAAQKPAGWPAIAKLTNSLWGRAEGGLPLRAGTAELRVLIEAESVDVEAELAKAQKDIDYYSGFKRSILAKLSNEKFMAGAPAAVIDAERKKLADAEAKIEIAQKLLAVLTSN
nr:hypothetical protein [Cryomorphaceae bacterium]